jgi:hypothetical protein
MYVTRHSHLTDVVFLDRLWQLYEVAYRGMAEEAVTREMLYRGEFDEAMADPTNRLWVVWDDSTPVGMCLVATDIGNTRYLSRAFFERHYPDHVRRSAVHYIMWLVVHPAFEARGAIVRLAKDGLALEAADGALLVFDTPQINERSVGGGLAEMMSRLAKAVTGGAPVHLLETQRYYAVDFAPVPRPGDDRQGAPSARHRA